MIKTINKVDVKETYFNIINAIYEKDTTNIILSGELLRSFPLWSGKRQDVHSQHCNLTHNTGSLSHSNQKTKRNKRNPGCQGRSQTFTICKWHDTHYRKPKSPIKKLLELIHKFGKVAVHKISIQKFVAFLYTNKEAAKEKSRN